MKPSNDEQVVAILARGVARVRAMHAARETVADVEGERCVDADEATAKEQQNDTQTEATR